MARRGNHEGTINQLPSGNWRAQIYINGYRLGKTKNTKKEAQAWLRQTLEKTTRGFTGHGSNMLYETYLKEWLSAKKNAVKKVQEITGEPRNRIYNLVLCLENK